MSTEEKARYDRAKAFLYTQSAEGLRQPNAVLIAYSQYRDAHIKAQEEYKNRELTAEFCPTTLAVQVQWREVDEPRLRQECQRLEQEWLTQGCKAQVEEGLVMQACEARAPSVTWEEWQKSFNLDLDTATDTDLRSAALTGFSPSDLFDAGSWPRFTLTKAEMEVSHPPGPACAEGRPRLRPGPFAYRQRVVRIPLSDFDPALVIACFLRGPLLSPGGGGWGAVGWREPAPGPLPRLYYRVCVFACNVTIEVLVCSSATCRGAAGTFTRKAGKTGHAVHAGPKFRGSSIEPEPCGEKSCKRYHVDAERRLCSKEAQKLYVP